MSSLQLRLMFFLHQKMIVYVVIFSCVGHFIADAVLHRAIENIVLDGPLHQLEAILKEFFLNRGARRVLLWTYLPIQIAWLYAGNLARKVQRLGERV